MEIIRCSNDQENKKKAIKVVNDLKDLYPNLFILFMLELLKTCDKVKEDISKLYTFKSKLTIQKMTAQEIHQLQDVFIKKYMKGDADQ